MTIQHMGNKQTRYLLSQPQLNFLEKLREWVTQTNHLNGYRPSVQKGLVVYINQVISNGGYDEKDVSKLNQLRNIYISIKSK